MKREHELFVSMLKEMQFKIRERVLRSVERRPLTEVVEEGEGDTVYAIDKEAGDIVEKCCMKFSKEIPFILVSESAGREVYPPGTDVGDCEYLLIIDEIDGTREFMYGRNRAWTLGAVARVEEDVGYLDDVIVAVQTPIGKNVLGLDEVLWTVKGDKSVLELWDLDKRELYSSEKCRSSTAIGLSHGHFPVVKYFEGFFEPMGKIADALCLGVLGGIEEGRARIFGSQYISTGGEIAYLATGKSRGFLDLRPLLKIVGRKSVGLCAHPYDVCTKLIAENAGAIVKCFGVKNGEITNKVPLDTTTDVIIIAYANSTIQRKVGPILEEVLRSEWNLSLS